MKRTRETWIGLAIVAVTVIFNAIVLAPELSVGRVDLNDSVFHLTIIQALADRIASGESVLDFWMPEWTLGYPVARTYQTLSHWLVVALHYATGKQFELDALFAFVKWLLLATFPVSVYAAARLTGFRAITAAAAAMVSPLIASPDLFGLEYGSYLWRGNGLYPQLLAMHLFALSIGVGVRAIRTRRALTLGGVLLGLTFLTHFIYGYMAAISIALAAILPQTEPLARRLARLAWIAAVSFAATAFQILPMLADGAFINRSRWEPAWKWESFGFARVFELLATGELLDSKRLPVLSLLALAGVFVSFRRGQRDDEHFASRFALAGAALWLLLFCGRPAFGPLFSALGLGEAAHLHRLVGGAHWFLLLLIGAGLANVMSVPWRRAWPVPAIAAVAMTVLLVAPPISERLAYLRDNTKWGEENLAAYRTHRGEIGAAIAVAKERGGRTFPGLAAMWGNQFRVGYVPFYAFLSRERVPAVAFLYHSMALTSDLMVRFDERRADHFDLFDIRTVISENGRAMSPFLPLLGTQGAFTVRAAPSTGPYALVSVPYSVYVDARSSYEVNDAWMQSGWPSAKTHLLLDYASHRSNTSRPRLPSIEMLNQQPRTAACGVIERPAGSGDKQSVIVDVAGDCFLLFKTTYHPRWRAELDGRRVETVMLTPGFLGVRVPPGRHAVTFRYSYGWWKLALLIVAIPLLILAVMLEKRGVPATLEQRASGVRPVSRGWIYGAALMLLVLPAIVPLMTNAQPNGHDAIQYLPRLVQFHENIRHGNLLPRWAPDLSSGQGQPLFVVNPPLFYYVADLFHLAGLDFVRAMNAACAAFILASAAFMFLLGRRLYGDAGGLVAALAYVYAPYFLTDAYVRTAFAELAAFPFYPLAVLGLIRYADDRALKSLLFTAVAYGAIWFAHTPAAVLFTPLLGAIALFLVWQRSSARLLVPYALALILGVALGAAVWMPGVMEAAQTNSHRLVEGPLKYSNHFVYPRQFFLNVWGYGLSEAGENDGMPFGLGWPHLALALLAAVSVWIDRLHPQRSWILFLVYATAALCFLMTTRSQAVWDALPQLHYVAFPWRLLASAAFCMALLAGAAVVALPRLPDRFHGPALLVVTAIIFLTAVGRARPQSYLVLDESAWTPQQIAMRGVIPATFDTFEPRWVRTRPVYTGPVIAVNRGRATFVLRERTPTRFVADVKAASDAELELPIAYFPGWRVEIDDTAARLEPPSETGRIRLNVVPGTHRLEAEFTRSPARLAGDATSGAGALLCVGLLLRKRLSSLFTGRGRVTR